VIVCFVYIGGIVDHHCLNFFFIISWIFIVLSLCNNSVRVDMLFTLLHYPDSESVRVDMLFTLLHYPDSESTNIFYYSLMLRNSQKAANINFIFFALI
jgi:hypothetical protein